MASALTNGINGSSAKRQQWTEQIERWRSSGDSVRAFCRRHGLSEASFYWWRRELGLNDSPVRAAQAVTSKPKGSTRASSKGESASSRASALTGEAGFAELRLSEGYDVHGDRIELTLPTGERILVGPGVSDAHLRRVLTAVREVHEC